MGTYAQTQDIFGALEIEKSQVSKGPVDQYFSAVDLAIYMCKLSSKLKPSTKENNALKDPDAPPIEPTPDRSDYRLCIQQYKASLKRMHFTASKSIKKPSAQAAFKEHLVLSISALEGIIPQNDERVIDYERRSNADRRALDQQKVRFEIEQ